VKLDRNHIISAGYIRNWAVDDLVECELVPEGKRLQLSPSQVGVRKKFYAGSPAPDGTRSAAPAERARGAVETKALPLLRNLADRWPVPNAEERAWVALWLAMTMCASPRQRQQIPGTVARFYAALEREAPLLAALTASQRQELTAAEFELDSMFEEVSTVASLLGQMHWTLLRFVWPALISSDHPVSTVLWTSDTRRSAGSPSVLLLDSLEVRVAVSPTTALLLTWADADDRVDAMHAEGHHLRAFNRGAWEQAERHRFWQLGTMPRSIDERRPVTPISAGLFRAYDPRSSARLDAALAWIRRRLLEQQAGVKDGAVVTAWMEQADGTPRVVPRRHAGEHASVFSAFGL
jgi:hypothetical protein